MVENTLFASQHSLERAKARAGYNEKKTEKMILLAIERGIKAENCHYSSDKRFLEKYSKQNRTALAFNGWCYIMDLEAGVCITILKLPKDFGKKKRYFRAQKSRNIKYQFNPNNVEQWNL